eukprot:scaffold4781_cov103-Skeletonema_dohrnii-CCMP3373.AAC.1
MTMAVTTLLAGQWRTMSGVLKSPSSRSETKLSVTPCFLLLLRPYPRSLQSNKFPKCQEMTALTVEPRIGWLWLVRQIECVINFLDPEPSSSE